MNYSVLTDQHFVTDETPAAPTGTRWRFRPLHPGRSRKVGRHARCFASPAADSVHKDLSRWIGAPLPLRDIPGASQPARLTSLREERLVAYGLSGTNGDPSR